MKKRVKRDMPADVAKTGSRIVEKAYLAGYSFRGAMGMVRRGLGNIVRGARRP